MPKPLQLAPEDPTTLPPRIATPMVLALSGYSRGTLINRIKAGKMPAPVDRGGDGSIWIRDDVLRALGLIPDPNAPPEPNPWDNFDPVRYRQILADQRDQDAFCRKMDRAAAKRLEPRKPKPKVELAKLPPKRAKASTSVGPADKPDGQRLKSIMRQLGRYVVIKPRTDGTYYVYMFVPLILRPKGWKATIALPLDEPRTGDLRNRQEFARIKADAATLYRSMTNERLAQARQAKAVVDRRATKPNEDA